MNQIPNIEEFVKKLSTTKKVHLIEGKFYYTDEDVFAFFLEQQQIHHQQLQKARQDWLREEIVRLEGEVPKRITDQETHSTYNDGKRDSLQTIIDRYQAELDQDVTGK